MRKLLEYRARAAFCRLRSINEPDNRAHWLAEAERWLRLERDEVSALFRECNANQPAADAASGSAAGPEACASGTRAGTASLMAES